MRRILLSLLGLVLAMSSWAIPAGAGAAEPEPSPDVPQETVESATPTDPAPDPSADPTPAPSASEPTPSADPSADPSVDPSADPEPEVEPTKPKATPEKGQPAPSMAATAGCVEVELSGWGEAPGVSAVRGGEDAECFEFTTGNFGSYAVRLVSDDDGWAPYATLMEGEQAINNLGGDRRQGVIVELKGATTYRLLVVGDPGSEPRGYRVGFYDVLGATGCDSLSSLGWTAASEAEQAVGAHALDCASFTLPTGRTIRVSGSINVAQVVNAAGAVICGIQDYYFPSPCELTGAGPYRVISSSAGVPADDTATLMVTDTQSDDGCTAITLSAWNDPLPPRADRNAAGRAADCYSLTTTRAGNYLLRSKLEDSRWPARLDVWESGSGQRLQTFYGDVDYAEVSLRGSRTYRFALSGYPDGYPGGVALGVYDITQTPGCATAPGLDWDDAPVTFDLADNEVACAQFTSTAGSTLRLAAQRTSAEHETRMQVYNAAGTNICSVTTPSVTSCAVTGAGPYRVLATSSGEGDAAARLDLNDIASNQGCTTVPLATWNAALPGTGEREPDGSGTECYTIKTAAAGKYAVADWFESTQWTPRVQLWDTDSRSVVLESSYWYWYSLQTIALRGSTDYRMIVSGDPDGFGNGYSLGLTQVAGGGTCAAVPGLDWSSAPLQGSLSRGETDCGQIAAEDGSYLRVRVARTSEVGQPRAMVVNKAGDSVCEVDTGNAASCRLSGVGPFRVLIHSADPSEDTSYRVWLTDPASTVGCPVPDETSAAALTGDLAPLSASDCVSLGTTSSHVFVPVRRHPYNVRGVILNGRGDELCSPDQFCDLTGPAPYRLVFTNIGGDTEEYAYRILRTGADNSSCVDVPSVAYGFEPLSGKVVDDLDVRCYSFLATTGDHLMFKPRGLSGQASLATYVVGPQGGLICSAGAWWQPDLDCTASATGRHTVFMVADSTSLGRFQISAECLNPACGPDELTVLSANPKTIGQSPSVTVTLQGKNFDRTQTFTLRRSGVILTGQVIEISSDRRTARVLFNLSTAATGTWAAHVASTDGEEATFASAVTVTAPGEPKITASLTGLGRFVPGRAQTMSLTVANSGNVDGIGVPIVLRGFPAGSTIEPQFDVYGLNGAGEPELGSITPADDDVFTAEDGSLGIPFYINRMPAGGRIDVSFRVTVADQKNYDLTASVGQCLVTPGATATASAPGGQTTVLAPGVSCANATYNALTDAAFESVPGAACVSGVRDVVETGITNWADNGSPFAFGGWGDVLEFGVSTAFSGLNCAADFFPPTKVAKTVLKVASTAWGLGTLGKTCYEDGTALGNMWVASLDPNEMVGPTGGGPANAIRGVGKQHYAVYFENSKDATAPAQVVTVDSTIDAAKFDMSSLTFGALQFGNTIWTPAEGAEELDHTLDLVSDDGLQLKIRATKTVAGKLSWVLETIDPATGEIPEDPFLGFLPPNDDGTEGQGVVYFDVAYGPTVTDGTVVQAKASIVFDLNPPILTNTFSNLIDRTVPTAGITKLPATTTKPAFTVAWTAADTHAGITGVDVFAAVDGGDYVLWKSAEGPGSALYTGSAGHTYSFAAVARDGAGNTSAIPSRPHATVQVLRVFKYTGGALKVKGKAKVGATLKSNFAAAKVSPKATKVTYQWYRGSAKIKGATKASYKASKKDKGKKVSLRITVTKTGYAPLTLTSGAFKIKK